MSRGRDESTGAELDWEAELAGTPREGGEGREFEDDDAGGGGEPEGGGEIELSGVPETGKEGDFEGDGWEAPLALALFLKSGIFSSPGVQNKVFLGFALTGAPHWGQNLSFPLISVLHF
jgi:hypothetical protein